MSIVHGYLLASGAGCEALFGVDLAGGDGEIGDLRTVGAVAHLRVLADDELRIGADEETLARRRLACSLSAADQVFQPGDQHRIFGLVVSHATAKV